MDRTGLDTKDVAATADCPVQRRYLHEEVVDRLRSLILSGELEPKSRVNENALAKRFGISRTPMREAIKLLAAEGLLVLLPNRGARVASISRDEIDEITEIIASLEALGAELACHRITAAEIERLRELYEMMADAWRRQNNQDYYHANRLTHEVIIRASRNTKLLEIYFSLSGRIQSARYTARKTADQWRRAIAEHELLVLYIAERRSEEAAQLMRIHIRGKKAVIAENYADEARNGAESAATDHSSHGGT